MISVPPTHAGIGALGKTETFVFDLFPAHGTTFSPNHSCLNMVHHTRTTFEWGLPARGELDGSPRTRGDYAEQRLGLESWPRFTPAHAGTTPGGSGSWLGTGGSPPHTRGLLYFDYTTTPPTPVQPRTRGDYVNK